MTFEIAIPVILIVIFFILNVPIWFALVAGVLPYFMFINTDIPVYIMAQRMVATVESSSFLAIPFFITAGSIMNYSGISARLMDLAEGLVGHLTGGLAHVNVLLSTMMGGISGSAAADAAMESKILVPQMIRKGYDKDFSAAITLSSSLITPIIPPGMGLIIYAFVVNVSVGRMFAAGYIPGIMCAVGMMTVVHFISKKRGYLPSREKMAPPRELLRLSLAAVWAILLPFGIILALRFGVFTANEAGAICAVYSLIVGVFIYRETKLRHAWPILLESVLGTSTVMIIISAANCLSYFMTYERIPNKLTELLLSLDLNRYTFFILVNILLLLVGMVMEGGAPLVILGPLLAPIAVKLGIDPIHFGLVMVFNLGIGNMSPPFGIVLFQVSSLLGIKMTNLIRASFPLLCVMLVVLVIITFVPQLVLFVPNLIYGS